MDFTLSETYLQILLASLRNPFYVLKQDSRHWNAKFSAALIERGFIQSQVDHSLFTLANGQSFIVVLIYVDDIIVASSDDIVVVHLKQFLASMFKLKDFGSLKYFLGLEVARSQAGISFCQRHYSY